MYYHENDPDYDIHPVDEMIQSVKRAAKDVMKNLYVGINPMDVDALHKAFLELCSALDIDMDYDIDDLSETVIDKEMVDSTRNRSIEKSMEIRRLRDIIDRRKHV